MSEQTKTSTPVDLSGLIKSGSGSPYVKPAENKIETPAPSVPVDAPKAAPEPVVVKASAPEPCAHVFVCARCNARLLPTEDKATMPVGPSPLDEEWNSYDRVDMPMRTVEQIRSLIPFENEESRTKRILNDKQRYVEMHSK
jgi:hypothetical protein